MASAEQDRGRGFEAAVTPAAIRVLASLAGVAAWMGNVDAIFAGGPGQLSGSLDHALLLQLQLQAQRDDATGPAHDPLRGHLSYQSRPWATVRLEISASDWLAGEIERVGASASDQRVANL
jgi:hypothetical protein